MLNLPLPNIDHALLYEASRERFLDDRYKQRLLDSQHTVMAMGENYVSLAAEGELHTIIPDPAVPPYLKSGDMQKLYSKGMLRKNSEARKYYERLRLSSPYRVCPFCLHRSVRTLDHYLPKAEFGAFAVLPLNLVPCCRDCNTDKDTFAAEDRASSIIHPYFDHIDDQSWLGCEIDKNKGFCTVTFYISSAQLADNVRPRLVSHMEALELFELYDVEGARELNEMSGVVRSTFDASGSEGVKKLCGDMAASRIALANNYWKAVLWRAAAADEQFVNLEWLTSQ